MMSAEFRRGVWKGIPIGIGYLPIGMAYGVLAASFGVPAWFIVASSFLVFAGSSQFMALNLMPIGATLWEIIATTFIVNIRCTLQSAAVAAKLEPGTGKLSRLLLGALTADEMFSVVTLEPARYVSRDFALGIALTAYFSWGGSTILGLLATDLLPPALADSMEMGLYAMFIGLLVPSLKERPAARSVALLAAVANVLLYWVGPYFGLGAGLALLLATLVAVLFVSLRKGAAV